MWGDFLVTAFFFFLKIHLFERESMNTRVAGVGGWQRERESENLRLPAEHRTHLRLQLRTPEIMT